MKKHIAVRKIFICRTAVNKIELELQNLPVSQLVSFSLLVPSELSTSARENCLLKSS